MSVRILKICAVSALSLALLYSGAVWAMAGCLYDGGHSHRVAMEDHHETQAASDFNHHQNASMPVLHCAPVNAQGCPGARGALAEISRPDKGGALYTASLSLAAFDVLRNDLWLEALFKRIVTFSIPPDLARHLFLSVLRI